MTEANKKSEIEIVAKVEHARHCANFIKENETFVFDLDGKLLPEKSTAKFVSGNAGAHPSCANDCQGKGCFRFRSTARHHSIFRLF